jgi:hypothetical protein
MNSRLDEIYYEFQNFPARNAFVRNNIKNDAYSIFAFETLFSPYHNIRKFDRNNPDHRNLLERSLIPPPDDSIDIFFEENDLDEQKYHVVQIKNSILEPSDINVCFTMMESTIKNYLKNPKSVSKNLKEIISGTDFTKEAKNNCIYYVIHKGNTRVVRNQKGYQHILNFSDLELIQDGLKIDCVPKAMITIDTVNNFIINNFVDKEIDKQIAHSRNKPKSLLCNFNGYDLALLHNSYSSSLAARNILYGQNLRESLGNKSKTYDSMFNTIDNEPDLFLFYNNGITILCSDFDARSEQKKETITLKHFSIINGAQTTSTLGDYLQEALVEGDNSKIEKLKKVFVLTKIYEINSALKEHEKIGENIRIFTNTQTPLSNRDMVSIRSEQIKIQRRFVEDFKYPNAFIIIKNGEKTPDHPFLLPYQIITNERLAQLCFAGPLQDPFTAKDKRSKLFNIEQQEGVMLNSLYHRIFDQKQGYLFQIDNIQLDELLFVYKLHEDTKNFHRAQLENQLAKLNQDPIKDEIDKKSRESRKNIVKRYQEIAAVFIFHNIAGYYLLKRHFEDSNENSDELVFNSRLYYNDKGFRLEIIESFLELVYSKSLDIITENSGIENIQNWTRSAIGAQKFIEKFQEELIKKEYKISNEYKDFISKAKRASKIS